MFWPSGKVAEYMFNESAFSRYEKDLEMRGWKLAKKEEIK